MLSRAVIVIALASVVVTTVAGGAGAGSGETRRPLEGLTWVLDQEASNLEQIAPEFVVTALFDDGTLSGSSGCNRYNTTYRATRTRLRVSPTVASTLMACSQAAMNVEASYLERIPTARSYVVRGTRLTVRTSTKGADLVYRALSARTLIGDWEVTSYYTSSAITSVILGTTITASFDGKTISGNGGCNSYSGRYETEGTKIEIGPIAATQRACLENNVTQQEGNYFAALELARTFTLDANGLTFLRADGGIAVTMARA